ncbi:flagellar basal-body MS-ring/collar protein FliF [Terasakiella sp. A23]|uniref:flagellar basal-body MS-ring/collar protein FliF n=1 Tax=Terasakiella sp. FCG-A23 TaxID=3080561 RepID=UPI0029554F85|nr:flagellar basal-body MS-ring/collar protein FliF [Terasakiella sp. A23]MDV7339011.1 flagellar basal-body MS-ring/collar protein FliF [Terasakiella sp. A23]
MSSFVDTLKNLGPQRLAVVGGVILALVAFFIYLMTRLGTPQMELLYSGLNQDDSRQIVDILSREQVPYDIAQNGAEIFVSSDLVGSMRLKIAENGLPSGGSVGYEVFDNAESIGSTNFQQNVNLVRALEGELARTIRSIGTVKAARVHLVLPRRELFSRERQQPSASVVLRMSGGDRLKKEQIAAVQHLVASAVPDLVPERISIVDDKGTLLAKGFDQPGNADKTQEIERQKLEKQEQIARKIEGLLERTVGFGKVRAEVYADMDFSRETSVEEEYDPEGQVVRSTSTATESEESNESENDLAVTVGNNLPDAQQTGNSGATAGSRANREQETVNYEISKKIINRVRETAVVNRLSVAVLVDGIYTRGEDGTVTYEPRSQEEMDQISVLVQSAIGYKDQRDRVDVINMRFAAVEEIDDTPEIVFWIFTKEELMKYAEMTVLGLVALLVILLVVRPLIKRVFEQQAAAEAAALAEAEAEALAGPAGVPVPSDAAPDEDDGFEELIDIDRVEGRVKASSVKKVGEIVDKHPEEALAIIRNWMYQEA